MTPKKSALKVLSVVTTVGLSLGAAPAIADDEGGGERRICTLTTRIILQAEE